MKTIKAPSLFPRNCQMIWTPLFAFVRDEEAARLAQVVADDSDTGHWLFDAFLCVCVAINWNFVPLILVGHRFFVSETLAIALWSILAVVFIGMAYKSGCQAISRDRIKQLEREGNDALSRNSATVAEQAA